MATVARGRMKLLTTVARNTHVHVHAHAAVPVRMSGMCIMRRTPRHTQTTQLRTAYVGLCFLLRGPRTIEPANCNRLWLQGDKCTATGGIFYFTAKLSMPRSPARQGWPQHEKVATAKLQDVRTQKQQGGRRAMLATAGRKTKTNATLHYTLASAMTWLHKGGRGEHARTR